MEIDQKFFALMKLLFLGASATILINGSETNGFPLQRGVRQRCLLAPLLILFVGEVLNMIIKKMMEDNKIIGIPLPDFVS